MSHFEHHHELRAEYFLEQLIRRNPIPWFGTNCNMHDIRDAWRNERFQLKAGVDWDDATLEDRLRKDVREDFREYLSDWCLEAARTEVR